jgi:hypothetical protein
MNQAIPMGSDFIPQASTTVSNGGSLLWPIVGIVVFAVVIALIAYKVFLE